MPNTPAAYLFLRQLIEDKQSTTIAEVGVWKAHFSSYILENCDFVKRVYSIDPYKQWPHEQYVDGKNNHSQERFDKIYQKVAATLSSFGERSTLIRDDSIGASKQIEDESLDLVWIDANHGYEWVRDDINAWFPKVKSGGIVSGDDYSLEFPGTIKAVTEYCDVRDIFVTVYGCVWYFEKDKVYLRGGRNR